MSKQLDKIKQLIEKRELARLGGGEKAIQKQHEPGAHRDAARRGFVRGVRHVQGAPLPQFRHGEEAVPWRRRRSR